MDKPERPEMRMTASEAKRCSSLQGRSLTRLTPRTFDQSDRSEWAGPGPAQQAKSERASEETARPVIPLGSARRPIGERRRGQDWLVGGDRSNGLTPPEGLAPRRVRGIG